MKKSPKLNEPIFKLDDLPVEPRKRLRKYIADLLKLWNDDMGKRGAHWTKSLRSSGERHRTTWGALLQTIAGLTSGAYSIYYPGFDDDPILLYHSMDDLYKIFSEDPGEDEEWLLG